jgi:hypothetical protein
MFACLLSSLHEERYHISYGEARRTYHLHGALSASLVMISSVSRVLAFVNAIRLATLI